MQLSIREQLEKLRQMNVGELRAQYECVFGEATRSNHKQYLFRRIAWRIQALAEGGLSERAQQRALAIANDADLRIRAPRQFDSGLPAGRSVSRKLSAAEPRLPFPGSLLVRQYRGRPIVVKVCTDSFEYDGRLYRSLSAIAREVTGTKWNGFRFFHLEDAPGDRCDKQ